LKASKLCYDIYRYAFIDNPAKKKFLYKHENIF
jgi:hypothetical protein